jgi:hypothetical protein
MELHNILQDAREVGLIVDIEMVDGERHWGCWVGGVDTESALVCQGGGHQEPFSLLIEEMKEVRVVT